VEPLFPCYVFVRCHLHEQADLIRYTHGVSSLVHFGHSIPSVPEHLIDELKQCFDSQDSIAAQDAIKVGSEVLVAEGSLLGSRGIVVRMMPAKQRVQVLLDFLGRTTLTEVDRQALVLEDESLAQIMPSLAVAAA
jgi:transcriptional antiterminator RfaH